MDAQSPLEQMLLRHEGVRLKPYRDTRGKLTVGVGRNLDDVGLSYDEARALLLNDIAKVRQSVCALFPWYPGLDASRQDVICDMVFNMGLSRFTDFLRMIAAIQAKNWDLAAAEMLQSQWADEVGARATELARIMQTGQYPALES